MSGIIIRPAMSAPEPSEESMHSNQQDRAPQTKNGRKTASPRTPPPPPAPPFRHPLPDIVFPEELPVSGRRDEIAAALQAHQVIIVSGETGSGKTTQLPKICLALGRGERGLIGHTQPRRIAARAVATRIAQELGSEIGSVVGYKVR